jgi:hypothetical protein
MNTEDLLRHQGRTWQSPTVGAPDLTAALARRARRTRALAGSLTALVLLAGAGIWAVWPYPGGGSVAAVPAPTSDAATVAAIARDLAAAGSNGDEVTVTGEAVRTTAAASVAALDSSMGLEPDAPVWVVQLRGAFGRDAPDAMNYPWLIGIIDAAAPASHILLYREQPGDLSTLGDAIAIEPFYVPGRSIDQQPAEGSLLTRTIREQLARSTTTSLTRADAVRTTKEKATKAITGHSPTSAGEDAVWLVQLQGQFECPDCTPLDKAGAHRGSVLTMVVDVESGELSMMTISDRARWLDDLGVEVHYDEPSVLLR